jgi:colanic acid/amylovoran biosynthesis glycosyltransferase
MNKIGYILSSFPVLSETFISTEIRAMERCGHETQPIATPSMVVKNSPSNCI